MQRLLHMPKRPKRHAARPVPIQLPLFADAASLIRVRPERNEWNGFVALHRLGRQPNLDGNVIDNPALQPRLGVCEGLGWLRRICKHPADLRRLGGKPGSVATTGCNQIVHHAGFPVQKVRLAGPLDDWGDQLRPGSHE